MKLRNVIAIMLVCFLVIVLLVYTPILTNFDSVIDGRTVSVDEIKASVKNEKQTLVIYDFDQKDLANLITKVFDDYKLFNLNMKYHILEIGNITCLHFEEKYSNADSLQRDLSQRTKEVLQELITPNMNDYEKTLAIHDWICKNTTYAETVTGSDQDIVGVMLDHQAVCAGYAKAFEYLLDQIGIQSETISGDAIDKDGNRVPHAWNKVYLNNEVYYFDVTWDDIDNKDSITQGEGCIYDWFGVDDKEMQHSHFLSSAYQWEVTKSQQMNYYMKNGLYMQKYTVPGIIEQAKQQGKTIHVKLSNKEDVQDLVDDLHDSTIVKRIMMAAKVMSIEKIKIINNKNSNCVHFSLQ